MLFSFSTPVQLRATAKMETVRQVLKARLRSRFEIFPSWLERPVSGWVFTAGCMIYPYSVFSRVPRRVLTLEFEPDEAGTLLRGAFRPANLFFLVPSVIFGALSAGATSKQGAFASDDLNTAEQEALDFLREVLRQAEDEERPRIPGGIVIRPRRPEIKAS